MNRAQLEHILRSASQIAGDSTVVIIGSQAILGSFSEDELPDEAHASIEADVAFLNDPWNDKSDSVDMHLGENSRFHETFGYYAQGVGVTTATPPLGWEERVVTYEGPASQGAVAICMEPHDLVCAKLAAHRMKDLEFANALLGAGLVDIGLLLERANGLAVPVVRQSVTNWLLAWQRKHGRRTLGVEGGDSNRDG